MLSTMVRPEDTIRVPRSYRGDVEENDAKRGTPEPMIPPPLSSSDDASSKNEDETTQSSRSTSDSSASGGRQAGGSRTLSHDETIELARRAVENGIQETKRSLAGSEAVSDVVKPKLTIDLGHSNISRIPEAVVDAIKDEVER